MRRMFVFLILVSVATLACRSADTGRADPDLVAFVPPDAVLLAGARMDQIRATALYQKLAAQKRMSELNDFAARTGFDPRKDVTELLFASNGKDSVAIARGRFHPTDRSAQKSVYRGYTLFVHGEGAYTLIDPSLALAGNVAALHAAIDQHKSGKRSAAAVALAAKSAAIPPGNQVWAVSNGAAGLIRGPAAGGANAGNVTRILDALQEITFAADLRTGLHAVATGLCDSEQNAKTIGDTLRGLVGIGRMSVPENQPELLRLYDAVTVDQQQRSVKLVAAIPPELIDKLLEITRTHPRLSRPAGASSPKAPTR